VAQEVVVPERDRAGERDRRLDQRGAAPARGRGRGRIKLSLDDFDKIGRKTPLLADLKPGGKFVAPDMYEAGGTSSCSSGSWTPAWWTDPR
jgi:hypothetical protein